MTAKRYSNLDVWEMGAENTANLLNELHEERNYFERKKCEYWNEFNLAHLDNIQLRQENEQLKKDILRLMYTAEHLVNIKKLEEKWNIDYNQFHSDLINGDEHL